MATLMWTGKANAPRFVPPSGQKKCSSLSTANEIFLKAIDVTETFDDDYYQPPLMVAIDSGY